jgi:YYY domain-containing protein
VHAPAPSVSWQAALAPILLLAWCLPYYAIVGTSFAKFARYMLPILPTLSVLLVLGLAALAGRAPKAVRVTAWVLALFSLGHGIGYALTYFQPHPWIETSRWAFDHIPPTVDDAAAPGGKRATRVMNEDWGDDLPVDVEGGANLRYDQLKGRAGEVNIVEWDSPNKLQRLCTTLSEADVLFLADPRAYGTYLRLPTRFPLTHAYYDLLFHDPGKLGFELAYERANPIKVFGLIPLPDSRIPSVPRWLWADESFTLYDRPHAYVFRRVAPHTPEEVQKALMDHIAELGLSTEWMQGRGPEELENLAAGGTAVPATASTPDESQINPNFGQDRGALHPLLHPVLTWWILVSLLGFLALPLALRVFSAWPAGGYALSRALGVLLFGWLAYNLAWLKLLPFTQAGLWSLLLLCCVAVGVGLRRQLPAVQAWFKANKAEVLFTEGVFAAAFLYFVVVRAFNPNIHDINGQGYFGGGEPLGMTYLSALTRCVTFPSYDPWLALHNSSYYYFGYVLAAALTKLSGFGTNVTYNLSLSLFFSLSLLSAYGLLRAFVSKRWVALGGAAMVALAGSFWSLAYLGIQMNRGTGLFSALFSHGFIWDPTRFPELVQGHIFEFPYFSYLYSDLHPHNMVVAFSLVLLALLAAPFLSPRAGWRSVGETPAVALLWLLLVALFLDAQYAINTWSWPVFFVLTAATFLVAPWAGKGQRFGQALLEAAWGAGALIVAAVLGRGLMSGFRHYFLQSGGNRVGHVMPGEWQMSSYIPLAFFLPGFAALAVLAGHRARIYAGSLLKPLGADKLGRKDWFDKGLTLVERLFERRLGTALMLSAGKLVIVLLLLASLFKFPTQGVWALSAGLGFACLGAFLLGGWRSGAEAFLWMLGAFTCFLVAGSEFYFVADRMNTIFKFWFNGWILMGVVFGAGLASAFDTAAVLKAKVKAKAKGRGRRPRLSLERLLPWLLAFGLPILGLAISFMDARLMNNGGRFILSFLAFAVLLLALFGLAWVYGNAAWFKALERGVWAALLGIGLLYPLGATAARIWEASQFTAPHLDGTAFMASRDPRPGFDARDYDKDDYALIQWLNANAPVTETLLEAPGLEMYKGYSRFAIYTGLPTLLGWDYQVGQQLGERTGNILNQRKQDAASIYNGTDEQAKALLKQYHVRWIVVGNLERRLYTGPGLDKFAHLGTQVAQSGSSALYRFEWDQP